MALNSKGMKIPPSVKSIPDLIGWLAETRHEGTVSEISRKLGASIATANFWRRGVVLPNLDYLERLAEGYDLPFDEVMELWRKSRRKRRGVGIIAALALTFFPGVSDAMVTLPVDLASGAQTSLALSRVSARPRGDIMSTWARRLRAWLACPVHSLVPVLA